MRVLFLQFLKGSGTTASSTPPHPQRRPHPGDRIRPHARILYPPAALHPQNFVIKQLGRGFVKVGNAETDPEDIRLVEAAWAESAAAILSGDWDLVVLDEINYAIGYKMLSPEAVAESSAASPR